MTDAAPLPFPPHHLYREFLAETDRLALLDWIADNQARFGESRLAYGEEDRSRRGSLSLPVKSDMGPWKALFEDRIDRALPDLFARAGIKPFPVSRLELEIVAYRDGDHFRIHRDIVRGEGGETSGRMLTGVYYLYREPKAFSGGELRLFRFGATGPSPGDFLDIAPEQNGFLVFPSWAMHEVRAVSCPEADFAHSRFAVNCWLHK